ncbi:universal stress protein [Croceimicrobium hydrocarbonivorans]|uniref:Universal stress protein n=1 Tax=Croceimicrobium hydrocarbonivorans TaxID=2761580 RepID=A0A7H0VEN2_9FLAO|nr:universal stress protein [Croceimicrobium hydrocarbonivorans]QNR24180.1 universal stress protein [Croceimicrobium hydrocarbonivorans]
MKKRAPFSRVLIALEGGLQDDIILRYSAYLLSHMRVDSLFLMHVTEDLALPQEILEKYQDLLPPKEEQLEKYLRELYNASFGEKADYKVQSILSEGDPFEQILRQSHIKDIDLIIMGRRSEDRNHQLLGARLAEQGPCSVLLVPMHAHLEVNEIFLPIDFSEHGQIAMHFAEELSESINAEVRGIHFYAPARGFLKNAEAERELRGALRDTAKKEWIRYKKELELPQNWSCELIENRGEAPNHALFLAEHFGSDLIVIASKGRTASAAVLMGSFAKEMIRINRKVPLLILKKKRENLDFFEALKGLLD